MIPTVMTPKHRLPAEDALQTTKPRAGDAAGVLVVLIICSCSIGLQNLLQSWTGNDQLARKMIHIGFVIAAMAGAMLISRPWLAAAPWFAAAAVLSLAVLFPHSPIGDLSDLVFSTRGDHPWAAITHDATLGLLAWLYSGDRTAALVGAAATGLGDGLSTIAHSLRPKGANAHLSHQPAMFLGTLAGTWLALQTSPTQMTDSHALLHSCAVSLIATAVELSTQPSTFLENIENFLVPASAVLAHWYLNRARHRSASKRSAMQAARLQSRAVS